MESLELKISPLLLAMLFAAAMWGVSAALPQLGLAIPYRTAIAITVQGFGLVTVLAGIAAIQYASTTLSPFSPEEASSLVTNGIYRYSRNPIYLGLLLALVGWSIELANLAAIGCPPLYITYLNRFQVRPEERALTRLFGQRYIDYRKRVRRWF